MINGFVRFENIELGFAVNHTANTVEYTVLDSETQDFEVFENVPQDKFFKALAILVHNDGLPDYKIDYPDAESIMGKIRWIP